MEAIGDVIINNNTGIKEEIINIDDISTIKLDSFPTSNGLYGQYAINKLTIGHYKDSIFGSTQASAVFQVTPSIIPFLPTNATLDSMTLQFTSAGDVWADTLFNTSSMQKQKFYLYQLKEIPELNYKDKGVFYNKTNIELDTLIATSLFYPFVENINFTYFKIDKTLADTLFKKIHYRELPDEDIYNPAASTEGMAFFNFLNYFKGLAIIPDSNNQAILNINADHTLKMVMHYSVDEARKTIEFPLNLLPYKYNQIKNTPTNKFKSLDESQTKEVSFDAAGYSLIQGMSGYLTKIILPESPGFAKYSTVLKAQLEVKTSFTPNLPVPLSPTITVYNTNQINEITSTLQNNSQMPVIGSIQINASDFDNTKYIFDITELYERLSTQPTDGKGVEILLSIPEDGVNTPATSFNQVTIKEKPIIRIYYADYR